VLSADIDVKERSGRPDRSAGDDVSRANTCARRVNCEFAAGVEDRVYGRSSALPRYRKDTQQTGPMSVARQRLANRFDLLLPENQRKLDAADQVATVADDTGISLIELAIAFVLRHPGITSAIIGPGTIKRRPRTSPATST
jgi:Aldo/keto reductase family